MENNPNKNQYPEKGDGFDDTMDIFDIDAHRRQNASADNGNINRVSDSSLQKPVNAQSRPVNPSLGQNKPNNGKSVNQVRPSPVNPQGNANRSQGARKTAPAMPQRMRVISSEVSQSELSDRQALSFKETRQNSNINQNKNVSGNAKPMSQDKMFELAYGQNSGNDYLKKEEKKTNSEETAEYNIIFAQKNKNVPSVGNPPMQNQKNIPENSEKAKIQSQRPIPAKTSSPAVRPAQASKNANPPLPNPGSSSKPIGQRKMSGVQNQPNLKPVPGDEDVKIAKPIRKPNSVQINSENERTADTNERFPGVVKALIYIGCVFVVSAILATFIILITNDVFAFVKDDREISMSVSDTTTLEELSKQLRDYDVISFPNIFVLWTKLRHNDDTPFVSGQYTVSPNQNYDEILSTFQLKKKKKTYTEVAITIPEGYTIDEIITLLVDEKGIGTREGFIDAIQNHDYDYWFIEELTNIDPDRKYRLEGYLYPDTYYIYQEWEEWKIINKMLQNFYNKFSIEYKSECENIGMTVDEVVNLASIIQMEAKYTTEYTAVSSVLHNRLKSSTYRYMLDCDSTIQYILEHRKQDLAADDIRLDNQYNSYLYAGLPPGPISNPTIQAIRAALYPDSSNYYFFVSDKTGHMLFARTNEEHNRNKQIALGDKK